MDHMIDEKIHNILRERQLIPIGMSLSAVELMKYKAIAEMVAEEILGEIMSLVKSNHSYAFLVPSIQALKSKYLKE